LDGFGVLDYLNAKKMCKDLTTIILTNVDEVETEIRGLESGAVDYIRKPLNSDSLLKRVQVHTRLIRAQREIIKHNELLEHRVRERTAQLELSRNIMVDALIGLLEMRDAESSNHCRRTQWMIRALGYELMRNSEYGDQIDEEWINYVFKTAPLHDVGKVGILDYILRKPGKLTVDEFEVMKTHVQIGVDALHKSLKQYGSERFVQVGLQLIRDHHEHFDGHGYPYGRSGQDISLEGRMMAVVDVYDALAHERIYKKALSHQEALKIIKEESGKHFDPVVVNAFINIEDEIIKITEKFKVFD
ncbi:MAG: HD domain-containing protein, partial [Clostridia bacterium]|nr:HD domain-containing protein [Clostridia bacterium]